MATLRKRSAAALLPALGAYGFFMLQFIVPEDAVYSIIENWFNDWLKWQIQPIGSKTITVAIAFLIPYISIVWFFQKFLQSLVDKLTMFSRLDAFESAIKQIKHSHERNIADDAVIYIKSLKSRKSQAIPSDIAIVMIELLLTDIRDAYQELDRVPGRGVTER